MLQEIRVSILGKNEIVREGLKRILLDQSFVVETAVADPDQLVKTLNGKSQPDLLIVDAHSDNENYDVCRRLHEQCPDSHVVLMADEFRAENVAAALRAGVDGYLVKAISCEPLGGALRLIALGEKVVPSQIVDSLMDPLWRNGSTSWNTNKLDLNLSDREIEILRCLISGDANKIIARRLDITEATVKVHIKAILRKLRVMNRTQAAIWAVTRGLHQDEPEPTGRVCEFPVRHTQPLRQAAGG
jgi:two-component system nitrate/nitrite response regulator NarL